MVSMTSPWPSSVSMPSFSNTTPTSSARSRRTTARQSSVFRAKREMDLVRIRSIRPASASASMRLKPSRRARPVPLIPSSA